MGSSVNERQSAKQGTAWPHRRSWLLAGVLAADVALVIPLSITGSAAAHDSKGAGPKPTIVLVHGDWADGSSWSAVIPRLQRQGHQVVAPPNQLRGPSVDAPYLASYLATIPGPIILVGHSYGGFVITNAATGNTDVKALVYTDAFIPDAGQTLADLSSPESCLDPATAFSPVPFSGGVDLYLRIPPNPPYPDSTNASPTACRTTRAAVLSAVQRPAAAAQLGEPSGPVVVVDRNPGPCCATLASRADVDPRRRAHLLRQGWSPLAHHPTQRRRRHRRSGSPRDQLVVWAGPASNGAGRQRC